MRQHVWNITHRFCIHEIIRILDTGHPSSISEMFSVCTRPNDVVWEELCSTYYVDMPRPGDENSEMGSMESSPFKWSGCRARTLLPIRT